MNKKKILIVSKYFYPQNTPRAFRTAELAKEFAKKGHHVTVLTPKVEEHFVFEKEHRLLIKDLGAQKWKPIELKGSGPTLMLRRAIRRFSNLLFEYPDIELIKNTSRALQQESGYDLMISIATPFPIHWGVARARTDKHPIAKTWVADCGDPYMGVENDTFTPPFYFGYVEKWFGRKADYLSVPTKEAVQAYFPEFHDKIKVIPQGFNFEEIETYREEINNPVPTFAYAGGFIPGRRDPQELLNYLISLDKDFRFHLFTNNTIMVEKFVKQSDGRIILEKTIPRKELLFRLSKMDFVVNFENIGTKQTPSKLIDYTIINKPILSVKTGDLDTETVNDFLNGKYNNSIKIDNPDQYRIENVCAQFLQLI